MCQSAMHCDEARVVVTAHQISDLEGSAFTLIQIARSKIQAESNTNIAEVIGGLELFVVHLKEIWSA